MRSVVCQVSVQSTRTRPVVVGHFTVESYHAVAVSLALVDRARLRCLVPPGYHVHTINHPLPRQPETVVMDKVPAVVVVRPLRSTMRPIVTDGVASSVGLSRS